MLIDERNALMDRPGGCLGDLAGARFRITARPAATDLVAENARLRAELRAARVQAAAVADAERRRIERDLHDGAQNRLVATALLIGRAKAKAADGELAELLETAIAELATGLDELRRLARGIHPAVLTERGLDAALASLAGRAPLPVDVRGGVGGRLPGAVESAAYFAVSEALQNVAKYAGAGHATIAVRHDGERLVVEVTDDGRGGARIGAGSGLPGLEDRVRALDGTLRIASPPGGPTILVAEIPCGS
jgi:signal transduction histidine kinase